MSTHHHPPTPQDPMPLDAEERALAARIARLGPHGEPSPALDARVLAAAHAAAAHDARAASRGGRARGGERGWRRARWPVGAGLAASVALAAGIAWQMRPLPAPVFAPDTAATDEAMAAASTPKEQPSFAARIASPLPASDPAPQKTGTAPAGVATTPQPQSATRVGATADRNAAAAKAMAPPAEEPVVFDAPAAVDAAAPLPAPPPPPPSAPLSQHANAQPPPAPPAPPLSESDAPADDVPPATAASPEVRDAWLARIRELAAAGHTDDARASLAEFRRRYPAFAVPEDLRPLLPPASPATQPVAPPR